MAMLDGYKIEIHVPCQRMPVLPIVWADVLKAAPALQGILDFLAQAHPFARLGRYDGNFEIQLGFEGFTPRVGSNPHFGQADEKSVLPSLTLTTFVTERVDTGKIEKFVDGIRANHPWEHPVIVITEARIFVPDEAV